MGAQLASRSFPENQNNRARADRGAMNYTRTHVTFAGGKVIEETPLPAADDLAKGPRPYPMASPGVKRAVDDDARVAAASQMAALAPMADLVDEFARDTRAVEILRELYKHRPAIMVSEFLDQLKRFEHRAYGNV